MISGSSAATALTKEVSDARRATHFPPSLTQLIQPDVPRPVTLNSQDWTALTGSGITAFSFVALEVVVERVFETVFWLMRLAPWVVSRLRDLDDGGLGVLAFDALRVIASLGRVQLHLLELVRVDLAVLPAGAVLGRDGHPKRGRIVGYALQPGAVWRWQMFGRLGIVFDPLDLRGLELLVATARGA